MGDEDLRRATALLEVGRVPEARAMLAAVIAREPGSARAACLMSRCHQASGDFRGMLAEAERACALDGEDEWAHRLRSSALRELGRPSGAVAAAGEAVRLNPRSWQPYVVLAEAKLSCGDIESGLAAHQAVQQALKLAPHSADVRVTAGRVAMALGNLREARAYYQGVLADQPDHAVARNNLAVLDVRRGRATAAAGQFASALAANPTDPLYARNSQAAATIWLINLQAVTSGIYLAARIAGAAPLPAPSRPALAVLVAAASMTVIGYGYRRLPPGVGRMVRWPVLALRAERGALGRLRRQHLFTMVLAALQLVAATAALASTSPVWGPLHAIATIAVIPAAISVLRIHVRGARRPVR
ncbi:MAG TPA: tetratricopeptide repeat protein [Rugosimonospora sp.]|nr:tetratricopeptide repeat protein [Rugosimonospora sp.]